MLLATVVALSLVILERAWLVATEQVFVTPLSSHSHLSLSIAQTKHKNNFTNKRYWPSLSIDLPFFLLSLFHVY